MSEYTAPILPLIKEPFTLHSVSEAVMIQSRQGDSLAGMVTM